VFRRDGSHRLATNSDEGHGSAGWPNSARFRLLRSLPHGARLHRMATKLLAARHDCTGWPQSLGREARRTGWTQKSWPRGTSHRMDTKVLAARRVAQDGHKSLGRKARRTGWTQKSWPQGASHRMDTKVLAEGSLHRLATNSDEGHGFSRAIKAMPTTALAAEVRFFRALNAKIDHFRNLQLPEVILNKKECLGKNRWR
jgi:hypothetical protein